MPAADNVQPKNGAELIAAERERQITEEGWTPEHDDEHTDSELIGAAISYALESYSIGLLDDDDDDDHGFMPASWPWDAEWWKPSSDAIRNLVKAGALIAAEIDRLQRLKGNPHPKECCQKCGRENIVWFTDNETWNEVMGDDGGILCPVCFVRAAEGKGFIPTAWRLLVEAVPAPEEIANA